MEILVEVAIQKNPSNKSFYKGLVGRLETNHGNIGGSFHSKTSSKKSFHKGLIDRLETSLGNIGGNCHSKNSGLGLRFGFDFYRAAISPNLQCENNNFDYAEDSLIKLKKKASP